MRLESTSSLFPKKQAALCGGGLFSNEKLSIGLFAYFLEQRQTRALIL